MSTDKQEKSRRAAKAAAHSIRTALKSAIAADLSADLIDRLRVLVFEIAAETEDR